MGQEGERGRVIERGKLTKGALKKKFGRVLDMEEVILCQKSRVKGLKEGDNGTKFLHRMASA